MNEEETYRKRIAYYRSILGHSRRLSEALERSYSIVAGENESFRSGYDSDTCDTEAGKTLRDPKERHCVDQIKSDEIFLHVYAPVITMYAEWVLLKAKEDGMQRLYFMARDGYLFYLATQELEKKIKTGIDLKYLKVSRYALRRAEYALPETDIVSMICFGGIGITFEKMMRRGGLTDPEIMEIAVAAGLCRDSNSKRDPAGMAEGDPEIKRTLQCREIRKIKEKLRRVPAFEKYVREHARESLEVTKAYLKQEGMTDPVRYGIVDSGWLGTVQRSLMRILDRKMTGYYFGLYEIPNDQESGIYKSFYLAPWKDIKRKTRFSICLFESVCSAPEGMTLGYSGEDDRIVPVVNEIGNPNEDRIRRNEELLLGFVRNYRPGKRKRRGSDNGSKSCDFMKYENKEFMVRCYAVLAERLLTIHMGMPTPTEAKMYGAYQFCDDVLESGMQDVAAPWDEEELIRQRLLYRLLIKSGCCREELRESGWPEGSIVNVIGRSAAEYSDSIQKLIATALRSERIYKRLMYTRKALTGRK